MNVKNLTINDSAYPSCLKTIASPPQELFYRGRELTELCASPRVAIVGSRHISSYGKAVTSRLSGELAERGVIIVSGLALGTDGVAHQAALEAGGCTVAVLPCGLDRIYPSTHTRLAERICEQGGTLISEYPAGTISYKQHFIARNRIVAGLADVLLITEAAEKSGTLHTARFALEQGQDVLAVPGNITSPTSAGTNNLIKTGATPVTSVDDVLYVLGLDNSTAAIRRTGATPQEQTILDLLYKGTTDGHELFTGSSLSVATFSQTLTMLEISGKIRALGNNHWAVV